MRHFYQLIIGLIFLNQGFAQTRTAEFKTPGSFQWTVPCGVTSVTVQAWGAGEGGSTGTGGGGGGAFASRTIAVTPGAVYNLYVGRGSASGAGDPGEDSYFGNNLVKAQGGGRQGSRMGGRAAQSIGTIRYSGGDGGLFGTSRGGSGGGGSAGSSGNGSAGVRSTGNGGGNGGNGGDPDGGRGGNGGNSNGNGYTGSFPGGGGGEKGVPGLFSSTSSGGGGNGQILISYSSSLGNYCLPVIGNVEPITQVIFAGINNITTNALSSDRVESFCSPVGEVMQGSTYPLTVKGNTADEHHWLWGWTRYTNYFTAFIDWNQDGDFDDAGEKIYIGEIYSSTGVDNKSVSRNIIVPSTALLGITKMRIIKSSVNQFPGACSNYTYGQAEDYLINVSGNCVQPQGVTVNNIAGNMVVCEGTEVTIRQTGGTLGAGSNWKWYSGSCGGALLNTNTNTDGAYTFTPTATGTYFIRAEGGNCGTAGACRQVTITVNKPGTIQLTAGTKDFAACKNINHSTYAKFTLGGDFTDVTVTGLPAGITGTRSGNIYTLSGTPTQAGTFNYQINLTGHAVCNMEQVSGTVVVNEKPGNFQFTQNTVTYCAGSNITPNQPLFTGGTPQSYQVVGNPLPAGLSLDAATGIISGMPLVTTTAEDYTIRAINECGYTDAVLNIRISDGNTPFDMTPGGIVSYCGSGPAIAMGLSGSEVGVNYQLFLNGAAVGSVVPGTGNPISFGSRSGAGTYTIKTTTGCISNMNGSTVVEITPQPTITFKYPSYNLCKTGTATPSLTGIPQNGVFSVTPSGLSIDAATGIIDLEASQAGTYSISYTVSASGACSSYTYTQPNNLVINAYPVVQEIYGGGSYCAGTGGLEIGLENSETGVQYQLYRNGSALSGQIISGTGTDISFGNQTTAGTYTVRASYAGNTCGIFMAGTAVIAVNQPPAPIVITPRTKTICQGEVVPISVSYSPAATANGSVNVKSGVLNGEIPNNSSTGIAHLLRVTEVPEGATITSVVMKFKVTHEYAGDLLINLKGPNGKVLNIANGIGGSGKHFTNTTISSTATNNISTYNAPFSGTYAPQGSMGVNGAQVVTANISSVNTFTELLGSLESNGNGNWQLSIRDKEDHGYYSGWLIKVWNPEPKGYFNEWEMTINYSYVSNPAGVSWSPAEDLFTDPGATIPYTEGTLLSKVYAKPNSSGLKTYTATSLSATGCNAIATTNLTVNTAPVITVRANYCDFPGKIRITAKSDLPVTNWKWSGNMGSGIVGGDSSYIEPNTAGTFYVTAKSASNACTSFGEMSIAQELVINGDFEAGNTGFSTDYTYVPNTTQNGLVPRGGLYTVHNDPNYTHNNFWGTDHTSADGSGNFMLVNGTSNKVIWKQTVTVIPNTTYYFSAYAVSLNDVSPFANLVFRVNNANIGTPTGALPSKSLDNNPGTWQRFYGNWFSGENTTAIIEIVNLQNAEGGNDFGLDDISFGTLSTFFNLMSAPVTESQSGLCVGTEIAEISYEAGGDGNAPIVKEGVLPPGLTTYWNGRNFKINGTPAQGGTFEFTLESSGCNPKQKHVKIVIDEPAEPGKFENEVVSACYDKTATIRLNDIKGSVTQWQRSEDGGASWSTVTGTGSNINVANITSAVLYKATIKNKSCAPIETPAVKVGVRNLWTGEENTSFTNIKNWSDETIPSVIAGSACPTVVIPAVANLPILSSGNPAISHLHIQPAASLQITAPGILSIAGNITNEGILDVTGGTIEFNGTSAQNLSGNILKGRTIHHLTVSNPAELRISSVSNDTLNITGTLSFGRPDAKLNTGDNITLRSTAYGTANVGVVGPDNRINGRFIVERFINTGTSENSGAHAKSWQLLATPSVGSTIRESWQEGAISNGKLPMQNPTAGYGTLLTTGHNNVPANGFDYYTSPGPSIKTFNPALNTYDKGPESTLEPLYNPYGYMVLVRGDRTVYTSNAAAKPTVLRSKGKILTGTTEPITVKNNTWQSIGNPYPSQIDLRKLTLTGGVDQTIFVWDPRLGGSYGLGAFQTLTFDGANYTATPGGGSYGSGPANFLQSGQAFMVQATHSDGTVQFTEGMKESGSLSILRGGADGRARVGQIRTRLNGMSSGKPFLTDGNLIQYSEKYSNNIDGMDARKMQNTSENLAIYSNGKNLAVERRKSIAEADTILFRLSGVRAQAYQFEIAASGLHQEGLKGWLEDDFLKTRTPLDLDGTTYIDFTVNATAGSYAPGRFRIVFAVEAPSYVLPVTFTSVKADRKGEDIWITWKVDNQINVKNYIVEVSSDGQYFTENGKVEASAGDNVTYTFPHRNVTAGQHFYRIRSVDLNGKTALSVIVKVVVESTEGTISVYPNPVTNGAVNLHLGHQPEGVYVLKMFNPVGQLIISEKINHDGGNHTQKIPWDYKMARGMYHLEVAKPNGSIHAIKIIY